MAKKNTSRKKKTYKRKKKKKLSRFNISKTGELIMAGVGVIIIAGIAFLIFWTALSGKIIKEDPKVVAREAAETKRATKNWTEFEKSGLLIKVQSDRENLFVKGPGWDKLFEGKQASYAEATAFHYDLSRCFVLDAATGEELGWYTKSGGYRQVPENEREKKDG